MPLCPCSALVTADNGHSSATSMNSTIQNLRPECVVSNGAIDAAIEVKRLTGDEVFRAYKEGLLSLSRVLNPECQGYFILGSAAGLRVPASKPLLRNLRKEVSRVAPNLARGETGALRIARSSWVSLCSPTGRGYVYCCHNYTDHLFKDLDSVVPGTFLLVDQELPDHSFITEEARSNFRVNLVEACARRLRGESNHFDWYEEVPLYRSDTDDNDRGLDILAVTEARSVDAAVAEGLDYVLDRAVRKFQKTPRWAAKHVIVLDREDGFSSPEKVQFAMKWTNPEELANIDLVIMRDGLAAYTIWENAG